MEREMTAQEKFSASGARNYASHPRLTEKQCEPFIIFPETCQNDA